MKLTINKIQVFLLACAIMVFTSSSAVSKLSAVDAGDNEPSPGHALNPDQSMELIPHPDDQPVFGPSRPSSASKPSAKTASAPAPSAHPTFQIVAHPENAYSERLNYTSGSLNYLIVPFDIVADTGYAFSWANMTGGCRIMSAPAVTHGLICSIGHQQDASGLLTIQYDQGTVPGNYTIEIFYADRQAARTASVPFEVVGTGANAVR